MREDLDRVREDLVLVSQLLSLLAPARLSSSEAGGGSGSAGSWLVRVARQHFGLALREDGLDLRVAVDRRSGDARLGRELGDRPVAVAAQWTACEEPVHRFQDGLSVALFHAASRS